MKTAQGVKNYFSLLYHIHLMEEKNLDSLLACFQTLRVEGLREAILVSINSHL